MSPKKKKMKLSCESDEKIASTSTKRQNESDEGPNKRSKSIKNPDEDIQAKKRKNFVTACEKVSYKAYFDHRARLLLVYLPSCMRNRNERNKTGFCNHDDSTPPSREMPSEAEEAFMIDARTNVWCEALEVCQICITPNQYLSAKVLKEVVEIMLNAHEDEYYGHSVSYLIDKCQKILMQNFSTHPPCLSKPLRKCYNTFLTSPLDLREKTFTNRTSFESEKGIIKYCMNRLEYEISEESKDESLVDKYENIPEEMKQSVKGLHWQKEKFEIFECHKRTDRIGRLMAVLESLIELLQFDLAIWNCRYTSRLGTHLMRSHRPLMALVLWSDNILYTGAVNSNCKQILRLFVYVVHLQYPEPYITTMTVWLNTVIQTFYNCETNSNSDFPNTGKYCGAFADAFYKIIAEFPQDSIIRVLEKIQPAFMRHLIGTLHLKKLLYTEESCVIKNFINFIKQSKWDDYPETGSDLQVANTTFFKARKTKRKQRYLAKLCETLMLKEISEENECVNYPKMIPINPKVKEDEEINCNQVVHTIYITLEAYLNAYSVLDVQETLYNLNEQLSQNQETEVLIHDFVPEISSYTVSEQFIKKYRYIYQMLKELVPLLQATNSKPDSPIIIKVFEKIDLLT